MATSGPWSGRSLGDRRDRPLPPRLRRHVWALDPQASRITCGGYPRAGGLSVHWRLRQVVAPAARS
eukprot:12588128-Alexandrium_andersonii.AAC.1